MPRLVDRVAIVTGGAQGIGGATARRLAEEGARVLIVDVDDAAMTDNAGRIEQAGGTVETLHADIGAPADIRAYVDRAEALWGRIDILVNNAYGGGPGVQGSALEVTEEGWDRGMALMAKALFLSTKHVVPIMQRGGGGAIVNIASVHGLLVAPRRLVYETGKAAVIAATRQTACDFGPMGIRVNAICPGHIVTERMQRRWGENQAGVEFFEQHYPIRRVGRPVDIANAVVFLVSDEASFVTGHTMVVDGGMTIQLQEDLAVNTVHYIREHPDTAMPY
jgi:meso-butanediol dehydrogenase/(S,S)-butanediol dehydrogenase/diacetyl reductase